MDEALARALSAWGAIGALLVAGAALFVSIRANGHAREQGAATKRQAIAAEAQVEVMRRQLEVMESEPTAGASAAASVSPWTIVTESGHRYRLVNGGTQTEHDVEIAPVGDTVFRGGGRHVQVGPRGSVGFFMQPTPQAPSREVDVTWSRQPNGQQREIWRGALPSG